MHLSLHAHILTAGTARHHRDHQHRIAETELQSECGMVSLASLPAPERRGTAVANGNADPPLYDEELPVLAKCNGYIMHTVVQ